MRKLPGLSGLWPVLCLLAACATPAPAMPVPEAAQIALPDNPEAADMTASFTGLMERKLPILDRLAVITARDRYVRSVFISRFSDEALDPDVRAAFQAAGGAYVSRVDTIDTEALKSVLEDYSWADIIEGDPALFDRVFSVVQHSPDMAFRAQVLAEIRPYAERGEIDRQNYALMYDKVELAAGRQQLYGSQYKCIDGQYNVHDLKDPETVDVRRAAMGMGPLQEYIEQGRDYYGPCTDD